MLQDGTCFAGQPACPVADVGLFGAAVSSPKPKRMVLTSGGSDDDENRRRFLMLAAEVDSATAMVALARVSRQTVTLQRYTESALKSYHAAMDLIPSTRMDPNQENEIWDRLAAVRRWLEAAGLLKD